MKHLLISIIFLVTLSIITPAEAQKSAVKARPNVIIINMDDMGYGDTEPYGMTGVSTPNFNLLARQGTRLTHFTVAQGICTASRAGLLTGCYPNRIGMSGVLLPADNYALNPKEETIASMLKKSGYKTAIVGKWHLGNKAPFLPTHYGFDKFFGLPYSNDMWPVDYDGKSPVKDRKSLRATFPPLTLVDGEKAIDTITNITEQQRLTSLYTEEAIEFIKQNRRNSFFLYLAHSMPHVPLAFSTKFKGKSESGLYGDVIMELDWSVGEILKALDKEELADNTLLIVTSDNGPWLNFGHDAGSSGGLREGKSTTWEGATRVPFFVRWPGRIEAGEVKSDLMTNMDLMPTIAAATGSSLTAKIDGENFLPFLTGETSKGAREVFYYYFGIKSNQLQAVRYKSWKLVLPHESNSYAGLHGKNGYPGIVTKVKVPLALYNLAHDPGEAYDVQQLYPDIVKKIMGFVEEAREDLGDDLVNRKGKNLRAAAVY